MVAENIRRRHLDVGHRACLAVELEPMYAAEAKKRQLAGSLKGGAALAQKKAKASMSIEELAESEDAQVLSLPGKALGARGGGDGRVDDFGGVREAVEEEGEEVVR